MSATAKKLEAEAMGLPARSRARLARRLIESLDQTAEEGVDEAWFAEATKRAHDLTTGKAKGVSAAKVFRKARSMLR